MRSETVDFLYSFPLDRLRYTISMNDKKQGIIYIIMAGFFFALMTFFVRMSGDLPTMQKAFFRNAVAAVAAVILLAKSDEGFKIKKDSWKGLFLRSLFGTTGLICNFYAVDHLAIADANILNKLSPFFAIIMSYFVLKEKANRTEWLCVVTAFIGAVFVVKPSMNVQFLNAMIGVIGGFGAGVAYTFVRKLGKQGERGPVIVMCFLQELPLQADSFQSQRHTPRHLQRRYRCSTIRRLSLPPCWGLSFYSRYRTI